MIAPRKKLGRNEDCKCGSGKKHKKCCGSPEGKERAHRIFITKLMAQCLYKIVELKGNISLTAEQIDSVPEDWLDKVSVGAHANGVIFTVKKEKSIIEVPEKRLIL